MSDLDQELWIYNGTDAVTLFPIDTQLCKDLEKSSNMETCDLQTRLIEPLVYMTMRGLRVASDGIERVSREVQEKIDALQVEIERESDGWVKLPNSNKQCREYFYGHLGVSAYKNMKTGQVTVDKNALRKLARPTRQRPGYALASKILEYRQRRKMQGTYYKVALDEDGRLRGSFNPVGAADSGRVSCSKTPWDTGCNAQTLPPEFRNYILADEGCVLYQVDLSQAENRIVAYLAPEPKMIEAFESGVSIHRQTAGLIFSKPPSEISEEKGSSELGGGRWSEYDWGKRMNHACNYGMSHVQAALLYEIAEAEAKSLIEAYFRVYPGVREYHRWITKRLGDARTLVNLYGRKRKFLGKWDNHLLKEAYSFIPQSSVADKIHRDCIIPIYYNQKEFGSVDLLLDLHDAIYFQIPLSVPWAEHVRILDAVRGLLEKPLSWMGREFTIPAAFSVGRSFGDMKELDAITQDALREVWNQTKEMLPGEYSPISEA